MRTSPLKFAIALFLVSMVPAVPAQADNFQEGFRVVAVDVGKYIQFFYARANGDVYLRGNDRWTDGPPSYLGNFFFGQPVPSDFLAGFHAVTQGTGNVPLLYYASSTGDVYRQSAQAFDSAPNHEGSFFFGGAVPADFQHGFHIANVGTGNVLVFYYASQLGDVYSQGQWDGPPAYVGNFFNGQPPLSTSRSTIGGVKSKYR